MNHFDDFRRLGEFSESFSGKSDFKYQDPLQRKVFLSLTSGWLFWHGDGGIRKTLHGIAHTIFGVFLGAMICIPLLWFRSESKNYIEAFFLGVTAAIGTIFSWKFLKFIHRKISNV